jgi:AraC family transcriptional regulator of adaptative response/methylated-DNA-[protein]-cysteine methyltransferase
MLGMRPSTYRAGGKGERVRFAVGDSALGKVLVAATERGICAIFLGDDRAELESELRARFPHAQLEPGDSSFSDTVRAVTALVDSPAAAPALPLDIQGTAFQRRVWEALQSIPPGHTLSYAELAARLGEPRAVRAVAGACAANKLAVAVPCHRVVARDGSLAGYRWGVDRKRALLQREAPSGK